MKNLIIAFAVVVFSSSAFARQYVQCSSSDYSSTDVMVVNLKNEDGGTLFISSGMQNDESQRALMKLEFSKKENGYNFYNVIHDRATGYIKMKSNDFWISSDFMKIDLNFNGFVHEYSCFSRVYND